MKTKMWLAVMVVILTSVWSWGSTEQERRRQYAQTALNRVETLHFQMKEQNEQWSTNVSRSFLGGVADVEISLDYGPGLYRGSVAWRDKGSFALFSSYGSLTKIDSGMNYLDFPMYLSYWREATFDLSKTGVTPQDGVWVNGRQAWYDERDKLWHAYIAAAWNLEKLEIIWTGHGMWLVPVGPAYDYGQTIPLDESGLDGSTRSPSEAYGLMYLGETSQPIEQTMFAGSLQYDETIGAQVLVCCNTLHKLYGAFEALVILQGYDQETGESVQYFSQYVRVSDGVFMIPLVDGQGRSFGIHEQTWVKFIYEDPSDGGIVKQQWDSSMYQ